MRVQLLTTPIRKVPTEFPPVACLSLQKALRKRGYTDVMFYDIDNFRPTKEEILDTVTRYAPDVVGISAVVSTAYAFTKWLSLAIKQALPDTVVILGGNLAASAEIVLRKTGVDYCVLAEGEVVLGNFVDAMAGGARSKADFTDIKGLVFLDDAGQLVNTGYEDQLPKEEVYDFDWEDLERASQIEHFFPDPESSPAWVFTNWSDSDTPSLPDALEGKRLATIMSHKGCVAKCTFCHRWDKGIRYIPVDIMIERIKYVVDKYNVGYLCLSGENFGSDRKWTMELCREMKPLGLVWRVGGMRANTVTKEMITALKDSGCVCIIYGMETGSQKMLDVMEKKLDIKTNFTAMQWTIEAGMYTAVQLVLGMPGESPETIKETIEFTKWALLLDKRQNPNSISINYAQALPGTPLYEYGRMRGLIGDDPDEEERHLLDISDKNASGSLDTLNFTDYPKLICDTWQALIQIETNHAYIQKYGLDHYKDIVVTYARGFEKKPNESGYFNEPQRTMETIARDSVSVTFAADSAYGVLSKESFPPLWRLLLQNRWKQITVFYPIFSYRVRRFLIVAVLLRCWKQRGGARAWKSLQEYLGFQWSRLLGRWNPEVDYASLRKTTDPLVKLGPEPAMVGLRRGR
jgi:anaerobic magnesium-protoporphyrin IX monomethyl ester cyclase